MHADCRMLALLLAALACRIVSWRMPVFRRVAACRIATLPHAAYRAQSKQVLTTLCSKLKIKEWKICLMEETKNANIRKSSVREAFVWTNENLTVLIV